MNTFKRHRFPPDIISYAVWLYHRFNLSNRDVEDFLAERGLIVSYETIRLWCIKFGTRYARRLKQRHRGHGVAHRELMPNVVHSTKQYANNRAEQSHELARVRERGMRRFKSPKQAQQFLNAHAAVCNLFNLGRHLVRVKHYISFRISAFRKWKVAVA